MAKNVDEKEYGKALDYMLTCSGHIIICGMGKSGHVGKKIAATLASTGTPSFFLHPSEAFHGDLGMITSDDVIILISNSGETDEVLQLIPSLKAFRNKVISISGNLDSTLSKNSDASLLLTHTKETCPNNLAPTTSTTLTIALGDALAIALMKAKQFLPNDFARFHPGGSLGRRLLTQVCDVMIADNLPIISEDTPMSSLIITMTESRLGMAIVASQGKLVGIITDGDLRRAMLHNPNIMELRAKDLMSREPKVCYDSEKLVDAERIMKDNSISCLIVLNNEDMICGIVQLLTLK
jgi:arabinose-5-phosphate isomerase